MMNELEYQKLLSDLSKDHAVLVVRVDGHDEDVAELKEQSKWLMRLVVTTLVTVLVGIIMALFGVAIA